MKISVERVEDRDIIASQDNAYAGKQKRPPDETPTRLLFVALILLAMIAAILLLDATLPLRSLWFHDALLTQMGGWPVLPSMLIFPERPLLPHLPFQYAAPTPGLMDGWFAVSMLFVAFAAVFAVYLLALRRLPGSVSWRFIIRSTLLIGCLYMLIPVVTSPDLFSYIAYARMGVLHDLNPLTTLPTAIRSDPIYKYVFWVDQPSAYGPTWAVITSILQWLLAIFRNTYIMPMVIALRVMGLVMHLISTRLVWLISGQLQQLNGQPALATRKRIRATLAFAWNPLLLFEACVNAHNDAVLLVFVLLMIWVLAKDKIRKMQADGGVQDLDGSHIDQRAEKAPPPILTASPAPTAIVPGSGRGGRGWDGWWGRLRRPRSLDSALSSGNKLLHELRIALAPKFELLMRPLKRGIERIPLDLRTPIAAACLLALGTCLKINVVLLVPALLCYMWMQAPAGRRLKQVGATLASYVAVIVLFYAPFWQGGAIFNVFRVNPATYRTINTTADFLAHSYNAIAGLFGDLSGAPVDSPAERFMHTFSTGIFVLLFLVILWRMVRAPWRLRSLRGLIYWMAVVWILYCAIGSPWFWPWYMVTFFGLFALLEASDEETLEENQQHLFPWRLWFMRTPWTARLLSISMLTLYCLITAPARNFVYGLPSFQWSDTTGAWAWLLPLAAGALLMRYMPRKKIANS
ncbi:MAG TPA: hypothetical protein VJO32_18300 [Ktedonobacteraceae bacterium]|nr:hypothetical protein [Ktedonobacteraceae bacterium]